MVINKYIKTAQISLRGQTNGGVIYMLPQIIIKVIYLVPLMFIWKSVAQSGADVGMTLGQMLSYTYINALLADMLIVRTFITEWNFDGRSAVLFTRPVSVFGFVISSTAGEWIPPLIMFSLPMAFAAPLFGISVIPQTLWALPSLALCASLGFALEFLYFCVTLRLRNVSWLIYVIRSAVVSFFSGTVIPFKILPFGLDKWMAYQPFGSLGGAPLSLFTGTAEPAKIILTQLFWNVILWSAAVIWFNRSRERMVSFGG